MLETTIQLGDVVEHRGISELLQLCAFTGDELNQASRALPRRARRAGGAAS